MSGGTWDFRDSSLRYLAEELAEKAPQGGSSDDELEYWPAQMEYALPKVGAWLPPVLGELYELMHELDFHFAGDSSIDNEDEWIISARERLTKLLAAEPDLSKPRYSPWTV